MKSLETVVFQGFSWWRLMGSNHRPPAPEAAPRRGQAGIS
nr:MAG TPA: hypothetical protein [Caudoviricetes sp.]